MSFSYGLEDIVSVFEGISDFTKLSDDFLFCCFQGQASPEARRSFHFRVPSKVFTYNLCVYVCVRVCFL